MAKAISIIIPTKDRIGLLLESLKFITDSSERSEHSDLFHEIIVVNDSAVPLDEVLVGHPFVKLIQSPGSGVATARNFGASFASGDILFFIDDDMLVGRDAITYAIKFHEKNTWSGLNFNWNYPQWIEKELSKSTFGRYLKHHEFTSLKGMLKNTGNWSDNELFKVRNITSQNFSILKSTFEAVKGYDESFPFAGFEDWEFSSRLEQKSVSMFIEPNIMTWHNESDRLDLKQWLQRKYRGGVTRKLAASKGFSEVALEYPMYKVIVFRVLLKVEVPLIKLLSSRFFIKRTILDIVGFRLIGLLLASNIFKGYTQK